MAELERYVWPKLADGSLSPQVDRVFPIAEADAAHALMASDETKGKSGANDINRSRATKYALSSEKRHRKVQQRNFKKEEANKRPLLSSDYAFAETSRPFGRHPQLETPYRFA